MNVYITVKMIQQYVLGKSDKPLILFGDSGCGKTSLMAKGSSQVTLFESINKSSKFMYGCFYFQNLQ